MPKETNKKNTKGTTSKKVQTKNTSNKNVSSKKVQTKKNEVKKAPVKNVETKVVETKNIPVEQVEIKEVVKEKKGYEINTSNGLMDNTPFVVTLCVAIILTGCLIYSVCSNKIPKTSKGKEIVATLKGKTITADDLYIALKDENANKELLNMIDTYIADKEVKFNKDNDAYVKEVVDYYKEYAKQYDMDIETFLKTQVGISGVNTEDDFYEYVKADYKKSLVVLNYISEKAKEEDLKKYYKDNYSDELTVRHILIEIDKEAEDADEAEEEALDKAKDLIKELKDTDKDDLEKKFEKLAKDNSDDTGTYSNGGLLENITKKDYDKDFYEASKKLKNGKFTTEPVKTSFGYHIILKISETPAKKYKDIKNEVKTKYAESKLQSEPTLFTEKWDEVRKQYKLSIKDTNMKKAYEKSIKDALDKTED